MVMAFCCRMIIYNHFTALYIKFKAVNIFVVIILFKTVYSFLNRRI